MVAEVQHFEFGLPSRVQAPDAEPNPEDYIEYTAWHISRALEFHAFKSNKTVEPVLHSFRPVSRYNCRARCANSDHNVRLTSCRS